MNEIRRADEKDTSRLAEIEIFNYRLNFYPIFQNDEFYFGDLQVGSRMQEYLTAPTLLATTYVYDDGVVKGFIRLKGTEVEKLFVEPVLQGQGIGEKLLAFAVRDKQADHLWALEKNARAIRFYERNGFHPSGERKLEEDTDEYLLLMVR